MRWHIKCGQKIAAQIRPERQSRCSSCFCCSRKDTKKKTTRISGRPTGMAGRQAKKQCPDGVWNLLCIRPVVHICSVIKSVNSRMNKTSPKAFTSIPCHPPRLGFSRLHLAGANPRQNRKLLSVSVPLANKNY